MPRSLHQSLAGLRSGDLIHGTTDQAHSLILLVLFLTSDVIVCRQITSGHVLRFSQTTGREIGRLDTWIDSIYPLPREFHDAFIDMDRTFRCVDIDVYPTGYHMTAVQKRAILFIDAFYRTHPIAGPAEIEPTSDTEDEASSVTDALLRPFVMRA